METANSYNDGDPNIHSSRISKVPFSQAISAAKKFATLGAATHRQSVASSGPSFLSPQNSITHGEEMSLPAHNSTHNNDHGNRDIAHDFDAGAGNGNINSNDSSNIKGMSTHGLRTKYLSILSNDHAGATGKQYDQQQKLDHQLRRFSSFNMPQPHLATINELDYGKGLYYNFTAHNESDLSSAETVCDNSKHGSPATNNSSSSTSTSLKLKQNKAFWIYFSKCLFFNLSLVALIIYLNLYAYKYYTQGTLTYGFNLTYTTIIFCYQHLFAVFLAGSTIQSGNNFVALGNLGFNVLLVITEMVFFGYQLSGIWNQKSNIKEFVSTEEMVLSPQVAKAMIKKWKDLLFNNYTIICSVLLVVLFISLVLEAVIYFFVLNKANHAKLQFNNVKKGKTATSPSVSFKALKQLQTGQIKKALIFLNSCVVPIILLMTITAFHSSPLYYLAILALLLVFVHQGIAFLPSNGTAGSFAAMVSNQSKAIQLLEIFIVVFNFFVIVQLMSNIIVTDNFSSAGWFAFVFSGIYYPSQAAMHCILTSSKSNSDYNEYDSNVQYYDDTSMVSRIINTRRFFLAVVLISGFVFNIVHFAIYLAYQFNYQWFVVIMINFTYVPLVVYSLDLDLGTIRANISASMSANSKTIAAMGSKRKLTGCYAIMCIFLIELLVLVFNYTSIAFELHYEQLVKAEVGQLFALVLYAVTFTAATYFLITLKNFCREYQQQQLHWLSPLNKLGQAAAHSKSQMTLDRDDETLNSHNISNGGSGGDNYNDCDCEYCNGKGIHGIAMLILSPAIHVASYCSILFISLLLNYQINNFNFFKYNVPKEAAYVVLVVSFVKLCGVRATSTLVSFCYYQSLNSSDNDSKNNSSENCRKANINDRKNIAKVAILAGFMVASMLCLVLHCAFMILRIQLIGAFYYGSYNVEIRFQIGLAALAVFMSLVEFVSEVIVLHGHIVAMRDSKWV